MSATKRKLVVGLGNVGEEYRGTRHNIGFMVLEAFAKQYTASWQTKTKFKAQIAEIEIENTTLILIKPTTFYNLSGEAAKAVASFYKIDLVNTLVVHDELDLPFGTLRTRIGGSDAGNNGIKNLSAHLGLSYPRIRIGIANDLLSKTDAADFVLKHFTAEEQSKLPDLIHKSIELIHAFAHTHEAFQHTSISL